MSLPVTAQHTWTREELEVRKQRDIQLTAKFLRLKASGKKIELIGRILEFQRSNTASSGDGSGGGIASLPELTQESRRSHPAFLLHEDPGEPVISPKKAGAPGGNPSHDSASSGHLSLRTNTSPRKDKGKGKATETADAEQLKGASGESPSSHTNTLHQPAPTTASSETKKRVKASRRRQNKTIRPPQGGDSSPPQNPEPNQNDDSQERFQVQQNVLFSDNHGIETRLKKLETIVSELQEENARIRKENADLQSAFNGCLVQLEELLNGKAPARSSNSTLTDLQGESAPRLGSPQPIKTPQPDTTLKAPPRHLEGLEVAPANPGPVEIRPTSRSSSHTLSGSHHSGSFSSGSHRKRKLEEPEAGPSVALDGCVRSKRVKLNNSPEELVDPASLQIERRGDEAVRGAFTTSPKPSPSDAPPTHALISLPDYPFNQGSPSLQQRCPRRTSAIPDLRHSAPSPGRGPEIQSSSTQLITPLVGDVIPGAPVQVVAVPVRGDDATPPPPPPPAIPAAVPSTESQSSDGTNSDSAKGASQVPASPPVEKETESVRVGRGLPEIKGAQPSSALDPFRFTGAKQRLRGQANPPTTPTPPTPDSSMRQVAPETPMATPTRYGTEIKPSMRHLY